MAQPSLKQNLRMGEYVLKSFHKTFPKYIRSQTFVQAKIEQHRGSSRYKNLLPKLQDVADKYDVGVYELRETLDNTYPSFEAYINKLTNLLSQRLYGNCRHKNQVGQYNLLMMNQKPHNVSMKIIHTQTGAEKPFSHHEFTVFGLKKDAKLENPATWGNKAVIVDAWRNFYMKATDALRYFEDFYGFDSTKHQMVFKSEDMIKIAA